MWLGAERKVTQNYERDLERTPGCRLNRDVRGEDTKGRKGMGEGEGLREDRD